MGEVDFSGGETADQDRHAGAALECRQHLFAQTVDEARGGKCLRRGVGVRLDDGNGARGRNLDRKSTRLNSSHLVISYAVFCLKKKTYKMASLACVVTSSCTAHAHTWLPRA